MADDGFVNYGEMSGEKDGEEKGWTSRKRAVTAEEGKLLADLKTTATLQKPRWLALARMYKARRDPARAEIAFLGARYLDFYDMDLMREWAGMVQMNRIATMTKKRMLHELNVLNQGIADVLNGPKQRLKKELQNLLFFLEREEVIEVGEGQGSVITFAGEGKENALERFRRDGGEGTIILPD